MTYKALALVAVRLNTKRLKKKALLNLYNKPLILRLTERLKISKNISDIVWCTSQEKIDDKLEKIAKKEKIKIFRGASLDVMDRFIQASKQFNAKTIVRVTGDNPLTDPKIIDFMVEQHLKKKSDYTSCNSIPFGARSEVISLITLKKCHKMLADPNSSEYMTWMLNRPEYFKVLDLVSPFKKINRPEISLTVDYKKDYINLKKIYDFFKGKPPSLENLIKWIDKKQNLKAEAVNGSL